MVSCSLSGLIVVDGLREQFDQTVLIGHHLLPLWFIDWGTSIIAGVGSTSRVTSVHHLLVSPESLGKETKAREETKKN